MSIDKLARRGVGLALKSPPLRRFMQRMWRDYRKGFYLGPEHAAEIPELTPFEPRFETCFGRSRGRINLLVPALSPEHVFGGIATALQVFREIRPHFDAARIIVTDEVDPVPDTGADYARWPLVDLSDAGLPGDHVLAAGERAGKTLCLAEDDYFMSTAWWTAHHGYSLLAAKQAHWNHVSAGRLLYLIQDYEPGFYPWSTRYLLARATYEKPEQTVALINSSELLDYLHAQQHYFHFQQTFSPTLNPTLAKFRRELAGKRKTRTLLVYARPGVERNAFPLVAAVLRKWVACDPNAKQWEIIGLGENFPAVDLGQGCLLTSQGKLSLAEYADQLAGAALGLSLMVSPHPSYPPLEMAAFGARVLTNGFANKNLSIYSTNLVSATDMSIDSLALRLADLAAGYEATPDALRCFRDEAAEMPDRYFSTRLLSADQFSQLVQHLRT